MRLNGLQIINKKKHFAFIYQQGISCTAKHIVLKVTKASVVTPMIAFIVSKKNGCAVKRTHIRRRLRALSMQIIPTHAKQEYMYLLIARPDAAICKFKNLYNDLVYCLHKTNTYV